MLQTTRPPQMSQRGGAKLNVLLVLALLAVGAWAWRRYAPETLPEVVQQQLKAAPIPALAPVNPALYKWKDAQGRWNITDKPPEGRPYETVTVDPKTNVLPAGAAPEDD